MTLLFRYICVLFCSALAIICGLFLFTNGFFLHKNAVTQKSNCSHVDSFNLKDPLSSAVECLKPRARVILLLVDALKYEFVAQYDDNEAATTYHKNKIPIIQKMLQKYPKNSRLFKFVADPPTLTMQRLKGLTTGTLPTFIEVNKNFAASTIEEDNFIDQNRENGNIFMGDSTWAKLYPNNFLRDYTLYSFDVADLDTVDRFVEKKIFEEMNNKDWTLLIGHTLGIDHCGHTFGMKHPQMLRKLNETNSFLTDLINRVNEEKEDTILFVIGDHGMVDNGDHGGESPDETDAAMFVYSTSPLMTENTNFGIKKESVVKQIGIVPTLSVILGNPIPFSNIGKLIIDALPTKDAIENKKLHDFKFILHSLWRNVYQVQQYIDTYSKENEFSDKSMLEEINQIYNELLKEVEIVKSDKDLKNFVNKVDKYFVIMQNLCYEEWVHFDNNIMASGLLIVFTALFSLFIIISGMTGQRMHTVLESSFLTCLFSFVVLSAILSLSLYYFQVVTDLENFLLLSCGLSIISCFALLLIQNWDCISDKWYKQSKKQKSIIDFLCRLIFIASTFGVFSNSFILQENKILSFFLMTLFCFFIYPSKSRNNLENSDKKIKSVISSNKKRLTFIVIVVCLSIRSSNFFWRYRPEDLDLMKDDELSQLSFIIGKAGSIVSQEIEMNFVIVAVLCLVIYVTVMKMWLRTCGNLSGYSPGAFLARYVTTIILIAICSYWFLTLQKNAKFTSRIKNVNFIAILVYILISSAISAIFYWPLSLFLVPKVKENINIRREEATIHGMYEKIKDVLYLKQSEVKDDIPIIYGLATVYSACFILLSIFLCLLYILLLGFVIAPSVIIMNLVCIALLYISAIDRIFHEPTLKEIARVPNLEVLCWCLIAEYFFFATGHQATFNSIHWDAGFIGIDGSVSAMTLRGTLIIINTFGSHIILGIMLPLLVIAPFTVRYVFPNVTRSSKISLETIKRGELLLFQNSNFFYSEVYNVCGKYIFFHACKLFACMLCVTIHSRHMMVWAIFTPRFIFEGIGFLITVGSVLTSLLLLLRIEKCIEKFLSKIV